MDVVHGRRRLALPRGPGVDPRIPQAWLHPAHRPLHSPRLEALRDHLSARPLALPDPRREPERGLPRRVAGRSRGKRALGWRSPALVRRRLGALRGGGARIGACDAPSPAPLLRPEAGANAAAAGRAP
jgi:hypothetical protein